MGKTDFDRIAETVQAACASSAPALAQNLLAFMASGSDQITSKLATKWLDAGYSLQVSTDEESQWIGSRLIWRSPSARYARKITVVSSRLGHRLDQHDRLFHALRTVVLRAHPRQDQFVVAAGCAAEPYVRRCTELFGRSVIRVIDSPEDLALGEWIRLKLSGNQISPGTIEMSPELPNGSHDSTVAQEICSVPVRDRAQFAFADQVIGLQVRRRGHMSSLLSFALAARTFDPGAIRVHVDTCDLPLSEELAGNGAVALHLLSTGHHELSDRLHHRVESQQKICPIDSFKAHEYLGHWTRRQRGPWPDQPGDEFVDELILGLASKDRSALSSLSRIVAQQKLLATRGSNRVGAAVVSFTSVPVHEWSTHRTFRSHRVRWDFEPYGVCIKRKWLEGVGAQPVIYGDEEEWKSVPAKSRFLFQPKQSLARNEKVIDWTAEREFRCLGDVEIDQVGVDDGFVFVPTMEEARHLATISRWPIAIVGK